jgi:copper homeostasis protein CutC
MCFGLVAKDGHANALAAVTKPRDKQSIARHPHSCLTEAGAAKTPTNLESIKSLVNNAGGGVRVVLGACATIQSQHGTGQRR